MLAKGNLGLSICRGVFYNSDGGFIGGFGLAFGHQTTYYMEIMAIILAIEIVFDKGWFNIWLKNNLLLVIRLLLKKSLMPLWSLHTRWMNCRLLLSNMNFRCSHSFWEINSVADVFANLELYYDSLH